MRVIACAGALAVSAASTGAPAAEPTAAEIAAARELFDEGIALEEKGQWQEALDRFRKVAAVKTTPAVRFHLGLCLENLGRIVDALVEFQRAHADASLDPASQHVAAGAAKHVADLKARVPRLVVRVPEQVLQEGAPVSITIDGAPVNPSLVGTPIPLDPGVHTVRVTASGRAPFSTQVDLVERGEPLFVEATLPRLSEPPSAQPSAPESPAAASERGAGPGALPWVFGGVGAAALVSAGVMYVLRQSTIRELESACLDGRSQCPDDKRAVADRGRAYTDAGNVLAGVGILGIATALVLVAVAPPEAKPRAALPRSRGPSVAVGSGPGTFGIGVVATF